MAESENRSGSSVCTIGSISKFARRAPPDASKVFHNTECASQTHHKWRSYMSMRGAGSGLERGGSNRVAGALSASSRAVERTGGTNMREAEHIRR